MGQIKEVCSSLEIAIVLPQVILILSVTLAWRSGLPTVTTRAPAQGLSHRFTPWPQQHAACQDFVFSGGAVPSQRG